MIGRPRAHYRLTGSTNDRARELAAMGAPHGTLVTAYEQSSGRGRQGRSWSAPAGSAVLMSLVLREREASQAVLPLAAAVAVCEASEQLVPVECRIKWPNDVWVSGKKLAGILVEGRPQEGWAVAGIGLNVSTTSDQFPQELRATATSLAIESGSAPSHDDVLDVLLGALGRRFGDEPAAVLEAWRARDALVGQPVRWADGEGTAAGIDDAGALLVDTAGGRTALAAGEVHLLR